MGTYCMYKLEIEQVDPSLFLFDYDYSCKVIQFKLFHFNFLIGHVRSVKREAERERKNYNLYQSYFFSCVKCLFVIPTSNVLWYEIRIKLFTIYF